MSKVLRKQRIGRRHNSPNKMMKKGKARIPAYIKDSAEVIDATVREIVHEQGRGAPLAMITLHNTAAGEKENRFVMVAVEGMHTGQTIQFGDVTPVEIGNCMKIKNIPEGTTVCSIEDKAGNGGSIAKSSGTCATVVGHNQDTNETRIKLSSGRKKNVSGNSRAVVGVVAGGGRCEKPLLKAGRAHYKHKAKGKLRLWPRVRGVAMNPVDHKHGGGNHQHIGKSSCVSRHAPPGQKVGQIAARRTGVGRSKDKFE